MRTKPSAFAAGLLALTPFWAEASGGARPGLAGIPVDFVLFAGVLLCVALFHNHTLRVSIWGAVVITACSAVAAPIVPSRAFAALAKRGAPLPYFAQ